MLGRATRRADELSVRLDAAEMALDRLVAVRAEERRLDDERWQMLTRRLEAVSEGLDALTDRFANVELLHQPWKNGDGPVDADRLVAMLAPLKIEIAAVARQSASDERQAQRAYLALVERLEKIEAGNLSTRVVAAATDSL